MALRSEGAHEDVNFTLPNIVGIGGVTAVPDDLFKISVEEAVEFLESFKDSVNKTLLFLREIRKCKKYAENIHHTEAEANLVFERLQKQLQCYLFGKGGISLTKNAN